MVGLKGLQPENKAPFDLSLESDHGGIERFLPNLYPIALQTR